jgi:hypothetical protein
MTGLVMTFAALAWAIGFACGVSFEDNVLRGRGKR